MFTRVLCGVLVAALAVCRRGRRKSRRSVRAVARAPAAYIGGAPRVPVSGGVQVSRAS
jgi:hypothetical protein